MKATGIVRRIDDLGRVVVPKEIRRTLRIREGDPLEIFTDREGEIILKKYSPINELNEFASEYAESACGVLGCSVMITDTDQVIAAEGKGKKDWLHKKISKDLEDFIRGRESKVINSEKDFFPMTAEDVSENNPFYGRVVAPIALQGDPIGAIILLSQQEEKPLSEAELKAAEIGASFLAKQMES